MQEVKIGLGDEDKDEELRFRENFSNVIVWVLSVTEMEM